MRPLITIPEDLGSGGSHLSPYGDGEPSLLSILRNLQQAVHDLNDTISMLSGGDPTAGGIPAVQTTVFAPLLDEGCCGYVVRETGGLAPTDAGDPAKIVGAVGVRTAAVDKATLTGITKARFVLRDTVLAGAPVYLARADSEPNMGAAGKFTITPPEHGCIARCGVVWSVPQDFLSTRLATIVFFAPQTIVV